MQWLGETLAAEIHGRLMTPLLANLHQLGESVSGCISGLEESSWQSTKKTPPVVTTHSKLVMTSAFSWRCQRLENGVVTAWSCHRHSFGILAGFIGHASVSARGPSWLQTPPPALTYFSAPGRPCTVATCVDGGPRMWVDHGPSRQLPMLMWVPWCGSTTVRQNNSRCWVP